MQNIKTIQLNSNKACHNKQTKKQQKNEIKIIKKNYAKIIRNFLTKN